LAVFRRPAQGAVLQDGILRYSRLAVCATNTTEALNRYPASAWWCECADAEERF